MKQETFTDIEYSYRKKKTKREEFLEIMDEIIPWDEWVGVIEPYYLKGKRGRPPMGIEKMLRMYLLQIWFNLSDPATEDAIYDSYAMRKFTGIDFMTEAVPDETTLCKFRHLLEANGLNKLMHMRVITLDEDGGATVELDLTDELLNPLGMAHGGTIFTLCDIAAGSAAASQGTVAVTLDSTIHYYRPGRCGKKLTAVAYERKRGRKVSVYMVEVHDDEGKHIADATFTMFYTGATLDDMKY